MYEIEQAPTGRWYVSKMGWGRPFSNYESASTYLNLMNSGVDTDSASM